jgi:hypothetical protein
MKHFKLYAVALFLAAGMLLASNVQAQNIPPLFLAAGSSGAFNSFALAAEDIGGSSPVCGTNGWSAKNGGSGHDNRGDSSITDVTANLWVVWDNTPEPNRKVCAYLAVDSVIGQRLFFGSPQGSLNILTTTDGNIVPLLGDCACTLPANIVSDLQGKVFNAAPSDIRTEDAEYATQRAQGNLTANLNFLGYGPYPVGAIILDFTSAKSAQVVAYNISGSDPITGQAVVSPTTQTDVGAQAMMIGVNTLDTNPGGLGSQNDGQPVFTNVDRFVAAGVFSGVLTRTRDLIPSSGLPAVPMTIFAREPTSGTFNTFEFTIARSLETNAGYNPASQELGVGGTANNPLNITLADGASRKRVVGTGEMVSEIASTQDSIGYAFWSFGNWANNVTNSRYLFIDGVDPIGGNGTFPTCTAPCPTAVNFAHIIDGSYASWNVLRVTTKKPVPASIQTLITTAQIEVTNIPDFVSATSLEVFRSHYKQVGINPKNGHSGTHIQAGGDMGGAVFTTQADLDYIADTGLQPGLVGFKQ